MAWSEDQERAAAMRRQMWRISTLGMELFGSIVGMFLLGWLLDVWIGTENHAFKLTGLVLGLLGGSWNFYKEIKKLRANPIKGSWMNPRAPTLPESPRASQTSQISQTSRAPHSSGGASGDGGGGPGAGGFKGSPLNTPGDPERVGEQKRRFRDPRMFASEHFSEERLAEIEAELEAEGVDFGDVDGDEFGAGDGRAEGPEEGRDR
ncbi:MAG: AtpZ/AtpI family protein [Phycisphaerales bacterium]